MNDIRINKICRLLQKELSDIFIILAKEIAPNVLISVSSVKVSPDLSYLKAYLSIFPSQKKEEVLERMNENSRKIRFELGQRTKSQLRKIPEIEFFIDDSLDCIEKIENLLKNG